MPPKVYKRPSAAQQVSRPKEKEDPINDPLQNT